MKKILIVSYFSSDESKVMAQWVMDKLYAFEKLNEEIILVSSTVNSKIRSFKNLKHFRVPSIYPSQYISELKANLKSNFFVHLLFLPIVFLVGLPTELVERKILGRLGDGYWSWFFSSGLFLLLLIPFLKIKLIVTTGGPASSHLSANVIGSIYRKKIITELQDPLYGTDIGHNSKSKAYLLKIENFIIKKSTKVVFVTKSAMLECQNRYPLAKNISFVYSSSRDFEIDCNTYYIDVATDRTLNFLHLGTIYSNRNFDNLITAIQDLKESNLINRRIKITNIGHVSKENKRLLNSDVIEFESLDKVNRLNGLEIINEFDLLLLIQHKDDRSKLTIPYKTWDYLNSSNLVFGLTNNRELDNILDCHGHKFANNSDIESIKVNLMDIIKNLKTYKTKVIKNKYILTEQVRSLID